MNDDWLGVAKKSKRCEVCNMPLNSRGKHNKNYLSPCVKQRVGTITKDGGNTDGWQHRTGGR